MRTLAKLAGASTITLAALAAGCGDGGGAPVDPGPLTQGCPAGTEACTLTHDFGSDSLAPLEERDGWCQIWHIGNPTELWVSEVTAENQGAYHHSNWFFVPNDIYDRPDGKYPCDELGFDELTAAVVGGVLFAQSTQSRTETQTFPPGAASRIPPWSRVVASSHLLNLSDQPATSGLKVTVKTVPPAQVSIPLVPFRLTYHDLHIPPGQTSSFGAECDLATAYQSTMGVPLEGDLYYVLPHFHGLGSGFGLELIGGARDGERIYSYDSEQAEEAWGHTFSDPVHLGGSDGATGFKFHCEFTNDRSVEVGWGIGDQEMCVMLGFAHMDMLFEAYVGDGDGMSAGNVGGVETFTGPCQFLGVPYNPDKDGGDPR